MNLAIDLIPLPEHSTNYRYLKYSRWFYVFSHLSALGGGKREGGKSEKLRSTYQKTINLNPPTSVTTASSFRFSHTSGCVFLSLDLVYDFSSGRLGICLDHTFDETSPLKGWLSYRIPFGLMIALIIPVFFSWRSFKRTQ